MADPDDEPRDARKTRPRPARWRRRAVLLGLAGTLLGGTVWHLVSRQEAKPRSAVVSSRSAVVGTWEAEGDATGRVEFAADGRFSAIGLPVRTSPDGGLTGRGRWALDGRGGSVALRPDRAPSAPVRDARLAVVRADGRVRLCVTSGSPGVLCDVLLRPAAARR
ncbi:hypothetical protein [Streptomyces bangladeshensis]|uniref:Uncharacterized protein n=1 Tax=Streptomyces bangladeshensis TaxID=295352 RepID=A0ABN3C0R0_9ACTN